MPKDWKEFFRKKGRTGGKKAAKGMTKEQRSDRAKKAAQGRWKKKAKQ